MPATTAVDTVNFGVGRLFVNPPGGQRLSYGAMSDITVSLKIDLKEIWSEGGFPVAVGDGHRSIDVTGSHYTLSLDTLAADLGISAPTSGNRAIVYDETLTLSGSPKTGTVTQGAAYIAGTMVLYVGGRRYAIVASAPVSGISATVSAAGVITLASGDTATAAVATYAYTDANGSLITIANTYQNSSTPYQLVATKRDIAPDGSIGQLILTLNACRAGGMDWSWNEGAWTVYKRTFKAYADASGIVGTAQMVNVTSNLAP
jgi:hypothetical protein